jgi:uncharacterized protein (TIGR03083 family)
MGEHAVDRFIELVAAAPDGGQRVDRSDWTVRDVAVHVDIGVRAYVAYLQGETTPVLDPYDLSNSNARRLSEEPAQSIDAVIARLRSDTTELFHLLAGRSADETVVWHGEMLSVASLVGLFLGEILVHGGDVARTAGSRWSVSGEEARAVLAGMFEIAPVFVDPVTARGVDATFDLRVRGGRHHLLHFRDGDLVVDPDAPVRPECHISAQPVALMRVLYGRSSQWAEIARGGLLAWGRKPWLAFGLKRLFKNP